MGSGVFFSLFLSSILSFADSPRVHRMLDSYLFSLKNYAHVGRTISAQRVIYILCFVVLHGFNLEVILSCLGLLPLFGNFLSWHILYLHQCIDLQNTSAIWRCIIFICCSQPWRWLGFYHAICLKLRPSLKTRGKNMLSSEPKFLWSNEYH